MNETNFKSFGILKSLASHERLGRFVDSRFSVPHTYRGTGSIQLFVLGQDPTVKNEESRVSITQVLNLNKHGSLYNYLSRICTGLGLDLDKSIYATNYLKNFFIVPPTQIKEISIFKEFAPYWLPLLREELAEFTHAPIITLGQPLLSAIVRGGASPLVREYWGYTDNWKSGKTGAFRYLEPGKNILGRTVFPFPHQPTIGKRFYADQFRGYVAFMKQETSISA